MKLRFNHSPFITRVRVPFNGKRFKNKYSIVDKAGQFYFANPNGGAWNTHTNENIEDADVATVCAMNDSDKKYNGFTGGRRIARDIDYFGKTYPVYCDGKFVYQDELPDNEVIIPIYCYAYRSKNDLSRMWILPAVGKIVPADTNVLPTLADLEKYTKEPDIFWTIQKTEVLSPSEVINCLISYKEYLAFQKKEPEWFNEAIELCKSLNILPHQYSRSLKIIEMMGLEDVRRLVKASDITSSFEYRFRELHVNLMSESILEQYNALRGPLVQGHDPFSATAIYKLL